MAKMISRTIKSYRVSYLEIDTVNQKMKRKEIELENPVTESSFEKSMRDKNNGILVTDVKITKVGNGLMSMPLYRFNLFGTEIEKKSDIKGRSITKELEISTAPAVCAEKNGNEWKIAEYTMTMIDGEFLTTDYNSKTFKVLEIGDWSKPIKKLIGMTEAKFAELADEK